MLVYYISLFHSRIMAVENLQYYKKIMSQKGESFYDIPEIDVQSIQIYSHVGPN